MCPLRSIRCRFLSGKRLLLRPKGLCRENSHAFSFLNLETHGTKTGQIWAL